MRRTTMLAALAAALMSSAAWGMQDMGLGRRGAQYTDGAGGRNQPSPRARTAGAAGAAAAGLIAAGAIAEIIHRDHGGRS